MNKTVLIFATVLILAGCEKQAAPLTIVAARSAPEAEKPIVGKPNGPTTDEALTAMARSHPNSRRVCIDELRINSFLLDYGPLLASGVPEDDQYHGWIFTQDVNFYKISNNTWMNLSSNNTYFQAYPDVTGLTCKETSDVTR